METMQPAMEQSQPVAQQAEQSISSSNFNGSILNTEANPLEFNSQAMTPEPKWFDKLPEELRGTASKFKDEAAALQAYHNLQSLMGKKITEVPKDEIVKHFSPDQLAEFYKAQGVPESPEHYKVSDIPEFLTKNPNVAKGLEEAKQIAHKHGVSADLFNEFVKLEYNLHQKAVNEQRSAHFAELNNIYGSNLSQANEIATQAAYKLGGDQAVQMLANSGLAANPLIFNMLYKAGTMMQEDRAPVQGTVTPGAADNASQIRQQIKELYNDPNFYSRFRQQSSHEVNQINSLYERLAALESRG